MVILKNKKLKQGQDIGIFLSRIRANSWAKKGYDSKGGYVVDGFNPSAVPLKIRPSDPRARSSGFFFGFFLSLFYFFSLFSFLFHFF